MEVCEACGKTITDGSIHSKYGVVCSGACYDHLREKKLEAAAKVIEKPSDFEEWEGQNMSEIFWIHLGKYVTRPNKYSLSLMRNAYSWAMHANHGLSNSFRNALKWAKIDIWREKPDAENYEEASL